ncbi:MAG: hypothetical protein ACOC5T_01680 [Elusimicrobiota bacterium]
MNKEREAQQLEAEIESLLELLASTHKPKDSHEVSDWVLELQEQYKDLTGSFYFGRTYQDYLNQIIKLYPK